MGKVELLSPAGEYDTMVAAFNAGADAVYLGGNRFGARAYANNFSEEEVIRAIKYAHLHGKKIYMTINTLVKENVPKSPFFSYFKRKNEFIESHKDSVLKELQEELNKEEDKN